MDLPSPSTSWSGGGATSMSPFTAPAHAAVIVGSITPDDAIRRPTGRKVAAERLDRDASHEVGSRSGASLERRTIVGIDKLSRNRRGRGIASSEYCRVMEPLTDPRRSTR